MPLFHSNKAFIKACRDGNDGVFSHYVGWATKESLVTALDSRGNTALHAAAEGGQFRIVDQLISMSFVINARNHAGETPLLQACAGGHIDAVRSLLKAGADPTIADTSGRLPVDEAAANSNPLVLEQLIAKKSPVDTISKPLLRAVDYNHPDIALLLIASGAKIGEHDGDYRQAIHLAARRGSIDVMKALLDKGADINARDNNGSTPLMWAVENGTTIAVEFLVSRGADLSIRASDGKSPCERAKEYGYTQVEQVLEQAEKAPRAVSASAPAKPEAPKPEVPEAHDDGESWLLMGTGKAAHVGTYPALNRKITEVFNFTNRERFIITENLKTGAETVTQPEKFETLPDEAVRAATEALAKLTSGGDAPKRSFNL